MTAPPYVTAAADCCPACAEAVEQLHRRLHNLEARLGDLVIDRDRRLRAVEGRLEVTRSIALAAMNREAAR